MFCQTVYPGSVPVSAGAVGSRCSSGLVSRLRLPVSHSSECSAARAAIRRMQALSLGKTLTTLLRLMHVPPTPVSAQGALPRVGCPLIPEQHRGDDESLRVGRTKRKARAARSTRVLMRQGCAFRAFRVFRAFCGGRLRQVVAPVGASAVKERAQRVGPH